MNARFLHLFCFHRYCVNIGSVHKFNDATIRSFINSHLSVCASLLSWLIVTYMTRKNFKMTDLLQGIMAGLVGMLVVMITQMVSYDEYFN